VRELGAEGALTGVDLPTPRGLFVGRVAQSTLEPGEICFG
jgi:hypothetical protein